MAELVTQPIKRISLGAKIIRADGTEEDLGTVAEYRETKKSKLLGGIAILNPALYQRYLSGRN